MRELDLDSVLFFYTIGVYSGDLPSSQDTFCYPNDLRGCKTYANECLTSSGDIYALFEYVSTTLKNKKQKKKRVGNTGTSLKLLCTLLL